MRALPLVPIAALTLALAAPATAAPRAKIVSFHAVTTVRSAGGANLTGTFTSRRLANGSVSYTNSGTADGEVHSAYKVKLKTGTLKGTATSFATAGGQPTDPITFLGAGRVAGGSGSYAGAKGNFSLGGK